MQCMDVLLSYSQSSDPQQIFQILDILGQGAYGNVSKALNRQTGQLYAIKILPATSENELSVIKKQVHNFLHQKIAILRQCNDQHIVKYYGSYFKDNNLWIVMQYCMAGSITDIVNITQRQLNENQIASILEFVLKGLKYLHDRRKIHRDIKAANILLDQFGTAKLADFGVSTEMMYTNARHNTHIGSPYWMSPQVIKYSQYNQKTDIWSLGVTAIQLAQGVVPYSHLKPFMAMWTMKDKPIQSFKQPQKWSAEFNDFIKHCLQINPQERPDAQDLLNHDFIRMFSKGKNILEKLVRDSMAQIENFRASQGIKDQDSFDKSDIKQIIFNKGGSNGSNYQTNTVIVKNGQEEKSIRSIDSVNQGSSNRKSFRKDQSVISYNRNSDYNDCEEQTASVIANQKENGHSRDCSQKSVSSVLVKDDIHQEQPIKHNQHKNYLQSYIQNLQVMHSKQQQFKLSIQQRIDQIQQNFIKKVQFQYTKAKSQLQIFFNNSQQLLSSQVNKQKQKSLVFQSQLFKSQNLLEYLYKNQIYLDQRGNLQDQFKEKYLSNIQPTENNYMSMMLQSGNDERCSEYNNFMQIIDAVDNHDNIYLKKTHHLRKQYRKKSQSSADSPTSLFNNKKKYIKKLVIQESLQEPNHQFYDQLQLRDRQSVNTSLNNKSQEKSIKQSIISKIIEQKPLINLKHHKNKYKQFFVDSANFAGGLNHKNLLTSTGDYEISSTTSNFRGQKRIIITQPHQTYDYQNDSISTFTKLHHRNLKQFYDDPVVMNNLKQITQHSQQFVVENQLNPFELKNNSFSKEIKYVKSMYNDKDNFFLRQKERATHIAHLAMAHNKERTTESSNKKLKVIQEREKSPEDVSESIKNTKAKKLKSKNKQTASTTIPFGSIGNMGALDSLPNKIGKSKQKKALQIPVKSGPFSKIKNKN